MNEKIKCIDNRGYSLTNNQEYDLIKRKGNFIFVNNDKDKLARYSAEMFEQPAPPPPARTEQDCINSITHNGNNTSYINLNNEIVTLNNILDSLGVNNAFSCGVKSITGINNTMDEINSLTENDQNILEDDLIDLQKAIFKAHLKNYMSRMNYGIFLVSTNIDYNEDLVQAIDEIADFQSEPELNPNSGNIIKVWGFLKTNL